MGVTFALVHGAWHGAWCWERLVEPLRKRGHAVVAVDLPCEDPEAGLAKYAEATATALGHLREEVVLVGHSLNGLVLPLVASRRPVRGIVYLAAFVPLPGKRMVDQFADLPDPILLLEGGRETDELGRSRWADLDTTARLLYPDLAPRDAEWAFSRLRPQSPAPQRERFPTQLPAVPSASVVCSDDRAVNPAWSRRIARERMGVEPLELSAGHFPMIAAPEALTEVLEDAAAQLGTHTSGQSG
jgi:pimeloyl-ACP methyl ester carboxylesterase